MMTIVTEAGGFVVPSCPNWCTLPVDHDIDEEFRHYDGSLVRCHQTAAVAVATRHELLNVRIAGCESVPEDEPDDPPVILIKSLALTAADGRRLAAALLDAADELDRIMR